MIDGVSGRKSLGVGCGTIVVAGIVAVVAGIIMVVAGMVDIEPGSVMVVAGTVVVIPGIVMVVPGMVIVEPGGVVPAPHPATTRVSITRGTIKNTGCSLCFSNILHPLLSVNTFSQSTEI